jgi:hypothetical protein
MSRRGAGYVRCPLLRRVSDAGQRQACDIHWRPASESRDEITLIDHALTRPWTVLKTFRRNAAQYPDWADQNCPSTTRLLKIGNEVYFKGANDNLLPPRKDQPPPDLRYFKQTPK